MRAASHERFKKLIRISSVWPIGTLHNLRFTLPGRFDGFCPGDSATRLLAEHYRYGSPHMSEGIEFFVLTFLLNGALCAQILGSAESGTLLLERQNSIFMGKEQKAELMVVTIARKNPGGWDHLLRLAGD